ncbi:Sensor kinase CckA [Fundidesulfovibrio magnetotacticus]|uniref:histidine kinase n=1 Tax=Fundidesulfovibrio magnetotacticus TaxID=2730080 RepID=A0A6V8LST5_9BACT|nr:PAS domain S-box protein [Fundidesulfovibrio magnetotacticus]GFK93139.1 Sensor kinase CckA [Fundidesulfovibrio magnetotacticus]
MEGAAFSLDARVLGQLLLMQSVVNNLPDEQSIFSFVLKGLGEIPGVSGARRTSDIEDARPPREQGFALSVGAVARGALVLSIPDREAFAPYEQYVRNFCFMLAVILQERANRRVVEDHQRRLEEAVRVRTAQLDSQVAERMAAEQDLRRTKAMLERIIDTVPHSIFWKDAQSVYLGCNRAFARDAGVASPEEIVGRTDYELPWLPEEAGAYRADDRHVMETRRIKGPFLERQLAADGSHRWLETAKMPLIDEDGEVHGVLGVYADITRRRLDEESLRASEAKYRKLHESLMDGYVRMDLEGRILESNASFKALTGYDDAELALLTNEEITPSPWCELEAGIVREQVHNRGYSDVFEKQYRRKDGLLVPVELRAYLLRNGQGKPSGMWAIVRDVSERKRAEEALRDSRELLNDILDSLPTAVAGLDAQGQVTHWNEAARIFTGRSRDEALGHAGTETLPVLAALGEGLVRVMAGLGSVQAERVPVEKGNTTRLLMVRANPLRGASQHGAVVLVDDVTERERLRDMMVQTEKMMSVGGLAAGMAHEINNPLGGILQGVQVLDKRFQTTLPANQEAARAAGCDMAAIHEYMERRGLFAMLSAIQDAALRATRIVADMLEFSRKSERTFVPTNIGELMDRAVALCSTDYSLKKQYDFKNIRIDRNVSPELPPVRCSATQIQQVLMNLLGNAAQAMGGRGPGREPPRIALTAVREGEMVRIEVEDNGPGMEESIRRKIFEPFFTTKPVGEGTGLGLSVSYFIVTENHQGSIEAESWPGKGTRFIIRLPLDGPAIREPALFPPAS